MSNQISIKLPDTLFNSAKNYAESQGFTSVQELIRELLRQKLFEGEKISGIYTSITSEKALAKNWLSKEEDKAWAHLQKER